MNDNNDNHCHCPKDPSDNVRELLSIYMERNDTLRDAEQLRINQMLDLRDKHALETRLTETNRINAIRAIDAAAVSIANDKATQQAVILAEQVTTSAEALRSLVAATASAQSIAISQTNAQLTDRITAASTQSNAISQIATQLTERIASLEKAQYERKGSGSGMRDLYGWIFAGMMGLATIGSILYGAFRAH